MRSPWFGRARALRQRRDARDGGRRGAGRCRHRRRHDRARRMGGRCSGPRRPAVPAVARGRPLPRARPGRDQCRSRVLLAVAAAVRALGLLVPAERFEHFVEPTAPRDAPASMDPPLRVAPPPRPFRPDVVADRQQHALWDGCLKYGNRWTHRLERMLDEVLDLGPDRRVVVTASGTDALRLAVAAVAPAPAPGATAILPSFTFPATAEVLVQLGYALRFVDVDASGWTLDPGALDRALGRRPRRSRRRRRHDGEPGPLRRTARRVRAAPRPAGRRLRRRARKPVPRSPGRHPGRRARVLHELRQGGQRGRRGWRGCRAGRRRSFPCGRVGRATRCRSCMRSRAWTNWRSCPPSCSSGARCARLYEELVQRHDNFDSQAVAVADRHAWGFWVMRVGAGGAAGLQADLAARRYRDQGVLPGPAPLGLARHRRRARRQHRARRGSPRPAHVVGAHGGARGTCRRPRSIAS